jgi:hypothetical protein
MPGTCSRGWSAGGSVSGAPVDRGGTEEPLLPGSAHRLSRSRRSRRRSPDSEAVGSNRTAARRDDIPGSAEVRQALSGRLTRPAVAPAAAAAATTMTEKVRSVFRVGDISTPLACGALGGRAIGCREQLRGVHGEPPHGASVRFSVRSRRYYDDDRGPPRGPDRSRTRLLLLARSEVDERLDQRRDPVADRDIVVAAEPMDRERVVRDL